MTDALTELHPKERAAIEAIHALYDHYYEVISPMMDRRPEREFRDDQEVRNLQIAQNVLRKCLEATLDRLVPYTTLTCGEIAIRLASYSLSAAPLEEQDELMAWVLSALPPAHSRRLNSGTLLRTRWGGGGLPDQDNVPGWRA